jgi:hypothetical protein
VWIGWRRWLPAAVDPPTLRTEVSKRLFAPEPRQSALVPIVVTGRSVFYRGLVVQTAAVARALTMPIIRLGAGSPLADRVAEV